MADDDLRWFDRPGAASKVVRALIALCLLLFLADAVYHKHPYVAVEEWFGFYGLYGFVVCMLIGIVALLLRRPLQRDEDYYDG